MSAFCDIWIGSTSPVYARTGNASWKNCSDTTHCFSSVAQNGGVNYINKHSSPRYALFTLGQFYENVDPQHLIETCTRFIDGQVATFDDPAGHYLVFLFDKQSKEWHVFTNRFGTYHAYWLNDGKQKTISTYFLGLARQAADKKLDWEGISGFFGMGFFPGTKTYLKNIQILAPATHYHFDASLDLIGAKRYWNWEISSQLYSENEYLDRLNDVLTKSLSHALRDNRLALPISGGLDSRMLAGIITNTQVNYRSLWGYSYGYNKTSPENTIAGEIAETRNIPFQRNVVPNYLFEKLPIITDSVELFQYIDGTRQACMMEGIASNADLVMGGHWGDVWMDSMNVEKEGSLVKAFENKILKRGRHWLLNEVVENFQPGTESSLNEYFATTIKQYDHLESPDLKFRAYKTDQWSFRWTLASIRMYQAAAFPVLPFYDKNVTDVLLRIPIDRLIGRKAQIEFIKRYSPDLAKITWQEYGRNLYSYKYFNNRNVIYRAAKKAQRTIAREKTITRNWEIFYMNAEGRRNLERHLLENTWLNEFVEKRKVRGLVNELYNNPSAANGYTVSMLLTFSEALNRIFD
jgi:asparagine synthetase B (glutamine-hydrolysing)